MAHKLRTFDRLDNFTDKAQSRRNERMARLMNQLVAVDSHIFRIESGIERPESLSLSALKLHRSGLLEGIRRMRDC
ncbi:hypothetical protein JQX08_12300 [Pseudomonas sp. UL073]|uniref:Uncharacterized protein n=1 Tax=Zestomonas insulae TaxID=2809017 RepID=A0ABS2IET7_9GAMM|nr:hypothetical protein [Pseudomonas insulae]MBM7061487.1 hypothetical protein [Pseudomonas insulae]